MQTLRNRSGNLAAFPQLWGVQLWCRAGDSRGRQRAENTTTDQEGQNGPLINESMNKWMNLWILEWMNEWIYEWDGTEKAAWTGDICPDPSVSHAGCSGNVHEAPENVLCTVVLCLRIFSPPHHHHHLQYSMSRLIKENCWLTIARICLLSVHSGCRERAHSCI